MELTEIKAKITSEDPQDRMRAITALRDFGPDVAVPLLLMRKDDKEFMIRSFVAMGLGYKQSDEAFDALVKIVRTDQDPNVRSEAANSLGKYGEVSIPFLIEAYEGNDHWLMRLSLFPVLEEMAMATQLSRQQFYDVCTTSLEDKDVMVKAAGIGGLRHFVDTELEDQAIAALSPFVAAQRWYLRRQLAMSLKAFPSAKVESMVSLLRRDDDHRVVAATLEGLVQSPAS
ncbi:MAG: HEAT repeat domain-containing protein [Cyanobacteria bacterium P01_F01_bin.42]